MLRGDLLRCRQVASVSSPLASLPALCPRIKSRYGPRDVIIVGSSHRHANSRRALSIIALGKRRPTSDEVPDDIDDMENFAEEDDVLGGADPHATHGCIPMSCRTRAEYAMLCYAPLQPFLTLR